MSLLYTNSSDMSDYVYIRNYRQPPASKTMIEHNKQCLKHLLPPSEHKNLDLFLDPGGNISRDCLGNLKQDINKVLDAYRKP